MRYTPVTAALSLVIAVSSSMLHSQPDEALDSRAVTLMGEAKSSLAAGDHQDAVSALEAALAVAPGNPRILVALGDAERAKGLPGKALHYYSVALKSDPRNLDALTGEGVALARKGARDKANRNLAQLKTLCGADCPQVAELSAAIAKGPGAAKVAGAKEVAAAPRVGESSSKVREN